MDRAVAAFGFGLLGALAVSGLGVAVLGRAQAAAFAAGHRFAAAALLLALIAHLSFSYARAVYQRHPGTWLARVGLLALTAGLYATGSGLVPGEQGAEGRGHLGAAAGLPAPDATLVLVLHAAVLAPLAGVLLARAVRRRNGPPVAVRARRGAVAVACVAVALPLLGGILAPLAPPTPEVVGAEAARAPWPLRSLEPIETFLGVPAAAQAGGLVFAALAFLPLLDRGHRPPWVRPLVSVVLTVVVVAYAVLVIYAGATPPGDHLPHG